MAVDHGHNPLFQNNVTYVVLLWGGLTTNLIWCIILNFRNRSFKDYGNEKAPTNIKLSIFCIGRHNLVPAILFLWNGREQTWKRRKFVDPPHGLYYSYFKCMGHSFARMEWG